MRRIIVLVGYGKRLMAVDLEVCGLEVAGRRSMRGKRTLDSVHHLVLVCGIQDQTRFQNDKVDKRREGFTPRTEKYSRQFLHPGPRVSLPFPRYCATAVWKQFSNLRGT